MEELDASLAFFPIQLSKFTVSPPNQPHTFLPTEMVVSNDNLRKDSSALTEVLDFGIL